MKFLFELSISLSKVLINYSQFFYFSPVNDHLAELLVKTTTECWSSYKKFNLGGQTSFTFSLTLLFSLLFFFFICGTRGNHSTGKKNDTFAERFEDTLNSFSISPREKDCSTVSDVTRYIRQTICKYFYKAEGKQREKKKHTKKDVCSSTLHNLIP